MKVNQIAEILNNSIKEVMGEVSVGAEVEADENLSTVREDLSNIVDVGRKITSATNFAENFDNWTKSIIDKVGKVVFADRKYKGVAPNIKKDSWQYGSILEKVRVDVSDFKNNPSWANKSNYAQLPQTFEDLFGAEFPTVVATYYNSKITFETKMSFTQQNLYEAFQSAEAMNRFISAIENRIATKMTVATDKLIFMTLCNLIAEKISANKNIVNLREDYNQLTGKNLSKSEFLHDKEALRYASGVIMNYKNYVAGLSTLYNDGTYATFTPSEKLKLVMATEFDTAIKTVLLSDTYNKEFVELDGFSVVPYWQGTGTSDEDRMAIKVLPASKNGVTGVENANVVSANGIVAVMFDDEACAVCCEHPTVESQRNPERRITNYFYQYDCSYLNDTAENCVVFLID